jgi:Polycystin cation channel
MYLVIFCAFVVMCHIYYGAELPQFGTLPLSMSTLFIMLMGNLSSALDDMITLSPTLSFFLFIAFITSMQFILMNMFIAFISNAYSQVNQKYKER